MEYTFLVLLVGISVIQITLCATNTQAPLPERWGGFPELQERENRPPTPQSEDDAFDLNAREESPSPTNSDSESLIQLLSALPPAQMQRAQQLLAGLLSPDGSLPDNSINNRRNTDNYGNALTNPENGPRREGNGRRQRRNKRKNRRRGDCRKGGPGGGMGSGRGEGYGSGMGYGSGTGYGSGGNGFGFGSGSGGGGDGYRAGSGTGIGGGRGGSYGAGAGAGSGMVRPGGGRGGGYGNEPSNDYGSSDEFDGNTRGDGYPGGKGGGNNGFGSRNGRNPYDSMFPNSSGTQGAILGGGSEIAGVKVNSFSNPGGNGYPSRMSGRRNAF